MSRIISNSQIVPNVRLSQNINSRHVLRGSQYSSVVPIPQNVIETDFFVYCPVCNKDYYNSQIQLHMRKHYNVSSYEFTFEKQKDLNKTTQSISSVNKTVYPLIEPLEFYTQQLDQVVKQDQYKFILNEDYKQVKKSQTMKKSQIMVQTFNKPPLQQKNMKTNWYNCCDNTVNDQQFSFNDVWKNNQGLASKRQLSDWQMMALSNRK